MQAGRMRTHPAKARREAVHHMTDRQRTLPNLASDRCRPRAPGPVPWVSVCSQLLRCTALLSGLQALGAARCAQAHAQRRLPPCWLAARYLRRLTAGCAGAGRSAMARASGGCCSTPADSVC
jgi:hypothetical protein